MQIRAGSLLLACLMVLGLALSAQAQPVALAHLLPIDVPAVAVEGSFGLDGAPFPVDPGELGRVALSESGGGEVNLGLTNESLYGPVWLVPGPYTPIYEGYFSSGSIPVTPTRPTGPSIVIDTDTLFDIEITSIEVSFQFLLNGAPFPGGPTESGEFRLRHVETGSELPIGTSDAGSTSVRILPGVYDVVYSHAAGTTVPQNDHAVVIANATLASDQTLVVDVPALVHLMSFTLNGGAFPTSGYDDGEIRLRNFETGDSVSFGLTTTGGASRKIIPGTYDATYSRDSGGSVVPMNSNAVVARDLEVEIPPLPGQLSFTELDVQTVEITLDVTLDGFAFPGSAYESGEIVLVGLRGDTVSLGTTNEASPDPVFVVRGIYDAYYRSIQGWTVAPGNPNALVASNLRLKVDQTLSIDIPTVEVSFEFSVDGAPFPSSSLERGDFTLVGQSEGDVISLGSSHQPSPTRQIIAGTYDVVYDYGAGSVVPPRNTDHPVLVDVELLSSQTLPVDLTTKVIVPTFSLNGAPFPNDPGQSGELVLRHEDGGELRLGSSHLAIPPSVIGIEGAYAIDYEWSAGIDVPRNRRVRLGYTSVPEPSFACSLLAGGLALGMARRRRDRRPIAVEPSSRP